MPDIIYLFSKWWKQIVAFVLVSLSVAAAIVFFVPKKYVSTVTALPGTSVATDKSLIFSENLDGLYSSLGSSEDLDRLVGTGQLDTLYLAITDEFNLFDHYKLKESSVPLRRRAAAKLKKNTRIYKSEYGELKIKVRDTDKNLASKIANAMLEKLRAIHSNIQSLSNKAVLASLIKAKVKLLLQADSLKLQVANSITAEASRKIVTDQLLQYEKLIGEYQLVVNNTPQILLVVEPARPAIKQDTPQLIMVLLITAFASILFGLLLALLLDRKKNLQS